MSSTHVMIEVMICVVKIVKMGKDNKALPGIRYPEPNQVGLNGICYEYGLF
jgi:hypothetical protein